MSNEAKAENDKGNTDVDYPTFNVLSLFSGVGGLDLGIRLAVPVARTVCYVEGDAHCCEVLAERMEEKCLDEAPIWSDVRTFDGRPWRGVVDCIIGGFPCQDVSTAGKRAGLEAGKKTGLWREFARIIGEIRPQFVMLENVPGLIRKGLSVVIGNLAEMGYDAKWGVFSAWQVGASHKRERWFLVGMANLCGNGIGRTCGVCEKSSRTNTDKSCNGKNKIYDKQYELLFAPGPNEKIWFERDSTKILYEPAIPRAPDGMADWVDRVRACGNGVVPLQAAVAVSVLSNRLGIRWQEFDEVKQ